MMLLAGCIGFLGAVAQNPLDGPLRSGDLLFQDLDCGELCNAIEQVTESYGGRHFSHIGMVRVKGKETVVIEAIGDKVRETPLASFVARSSNELLVGRLKASYQALLTPALAFARRQLGKPYDDAFLYDNGKYYCSELLYDAFREANGGKAFFVLQPMTFKQPGSDDFFPVWVDYYAKLRMPVPEGAPGINPGGISLSDKIDVFSYRP